MPKVSVLVPIYNVQDFLRECLDSLVNQTLEDIEIICINDGSTDSSPAIIAEYSAQDPRIKVITKPNTGYGDSMNQGLAVAQGEYLGIVEPDDFVELDMFESLTAVADQHAADLVKCNYFEFEGNAKTLFGKQGRNRRLKIYEEFNIPYDKPFDPADRPEILTVRPSIWAGIYRRDWLNRHKIDFAPTPGASFQDTSFAHSCWIAARKAVVMRRPLLHYRVDNVGSSVKSGAKVFAICDEYSRTEAFLEACGQQAVETFAPTLNAMRYCSYLWNYNRILPEYHEEFAERWSGEMRKALRDGHVDRNMLQERDQHDLDILMADPQEFCRRHPDEIEWRGYRVKGWAEHAALQTRSTVAASEATTTSEASPTNEATTTNEASKTTDPADNPPVVSIIIPIYNVEDFIRECIESLQTQTFADFEAICVSDGSTDASMALVRVIADDDPRFRFFEKENGGQGSARNFGIEQAHGTYITFLDPDDYYAPETLDELVTYAQQNDLDYLDFTAHSFYETARARQARNESYYESRPHIDGVMTGRELFVAYQRAVEYHCSVCLHFFNRHLLDATEDAPELRFDESLPVHEDELFSPLLISRAKRAAYLPKALYQRRVRDESSMTSGRGLRNVACMYEVQKQLRAFAEEEMAAKAVDPACQEYADALLQRVAELRGIMAEDALRVEPAELSAYAAELPEGERVEFKLLSIQAARQLDIARNTFEQRIGSAVMAAPRWIKRRL